MDTKKCNYCQKEILGKRNDAKFCSNTCKAKNWEEKKLSTTPNKTSTIANNLRGVMNENDNATNLPKKVEMLPQLKPEISDQDNLKKFMYKADYKRLIDVRTVLNADITNLETKLQQIAPNNNGWILASTGIGAFIGNKTSEKKEQGTIVGSLAGLVLGAIIQDATKQPVTFEKKAMIFKMQQEIKAKSELLNKTNSELKAITEKLNLMAKSQIITEQKLISKAQILELLALDSETIKPTLGLDRDVLQTDISSDKIINSHDLKKMEFKALNFQGEWQHFFGFPSINFHCVIHGMSGEGKSTFSIQFAKYLADNFGRAIYVSGEEGFSKTFKDKFSNNHAVSQFLDVADLRTFDNIIQEVPQETYNFIFIDSLDNMKIDADRMKKIKVHYKNSALITIS